MDNSVDNNTIDLRELLSLLARNWFRLVAWTVVFGIVGWGVANFLVTPKYTSSTQILVNQKQTQDTNMNYANQQADIQVINTYKDIITSPVILKAASKRLANPYKVIKEAQPAKYTTDGNGNRKLVKKAQPAVIDRTGKSYTMSAGQLAASISVATQQNSQVFKVTATTNTAEKAQAAANAVAQVFKEKIGDIMNVNNVTIVAEATTGTQTYPKVKMFALAGALAGFIIALSIILIKRMLDTSVRDDTFLTKELELTNLGQISHFTVSSKFSLNNNTKAKRTRRV